jgi:hypothetical protein
VDDEGRVRMGREAMGGMMDEERVGGWMMRLRWMWVADEKIESTGYFSWSTGRESSPTTVK